MKKIPEELMERLRREKEQEYERGWQTGLKFVEEHGYIGIQDIDGRGDEADFESWLADQHGIEGSPACIEGFLDVVSEAARELEEEEEIGIGVVRSPREPTAK